ncbi:MAG: PepSY-like domain-containing protein [Alistipes sp.]|nr:PepSY-like domain-containing protein [Alistipes sp.]
MKRFLLFIACAATAFTANAAPQEVDFDKLPKNSQEFIQKNFPGEKTKSVEMDREASWDKYTVYFNSGNQVSFEGGTGECSQIIMKTGAVPMTVLPTKVKSYLLGKYSNLQVVSWQTTADGSKVGLSDKTWLDFDKDGNFVKATK